MDIAKKLATIGITGSLYKLYTAAIELGEAPIADVAARAGLVRTTAYDALSRLEQEGLVVLHHRHGKRYVEAQDPTVLLERLEGRRQMLDQLMPQLRSMYNRAKGKPQIRFYEGIEGIRTALRDTLTTTGEPKVMHGILSMEELMQTPGKEEMDLYIEDRIKHGIWLNVIRSEQKDVEPIWPSSPDLMRSLRYCPPHMVLSMTTFIYDQRVCLISSKKENYGLIIDSVEFATMQRTLFNAIWELSRPAG
ncbi:TrmB family transcriptional regulator [Pusillimonas noertemannii]|uniref:Sugar-specific transcriptional regulator TrmB n=1 Tax=Pusillimonas noertemannii TaxID=305977 RepID=A0A2U1CPJ2_9BURK|nr:helix-turn-helix domain-containing protein [Pusillimonas noertemannii]NYT67130.1 transcriptional regulator TrmB [Pusillimonas noertemannii]PVY67805.1 sugar-specific transcriptional regulator TrmB [Pusillimonas noertemannii]TFL12668.1 transcriptional regulator TrmB [Pusillimonas noertemannii]